MIAAGERRAELSCVRYQLPLKFACIGVHGFMRGTGGLDTRLAALPRCCFHPAPARHPQLFHLVVCQHRRPSPINYTPIRWAQTWNARIHRPSITRFFIWREQAAALCNNQGSDFGTRVEAPRSALKEATVWFCDVYGVASQQKDRDNRLSNNRLMRSLGGLIKASPATSPTCPSGPAFV